jgi:FtsZ-binding cell division protein ZapB
MAAQHSIELLELRVSEMIERLKSLRVEKVNLSAEIHQQKSDLRLLHEERRVVRKRLEKILGTINHVEGKEPTK